MNIDLNIYQIMGIAMIAIVMCILFKQFKPEYVLFISITTGILIFGSVLTTLVPTFKTIETVLTQYKSGNMYITAILKTLGVCYVTTFITDCCNDCGQTVIASKVSLAGKVSIVVISLPLFDNLIKQAVSLLE